MASKLFDDINFNQDDVCISSLSSEISPILKALFTNYHDIEDHSLFIKLLNENEAILLTLLVARKQGILDARLLDEILLNFDI